MEKYITSNVRVIAFGIISFTILGVYTLKSKSFMKIDLDVINPTITIEIDGRKSDQTNTY